MMDNITTVKQYLTIASRRKWWIIIPFLFSLLGGYTFALISPKAYEGKTLILVQSQEVPSNFVQTIVSTTVEDRLNTIKEQVVSRTNLEKIINEYKLFNANDNNLSVDGKVSIMRDNISINLRRSGKRQPADAFTISFRYTDPQKVMLVTNALASNFLSENMKIREAQAMGTTSFLAAELLTAEKRLLEKEEELKKYRERYMGGLPNQLGSNLRILENLQGELNQLNDNIRDAENRKLIIQDQIAESTAIPEAGGYGPTDIQSLKNQLAALESRYTSSHPDVVRLKKIITKLELAASKNSAEIGLGTSTHPQLQAITSEISGFKADALKLRSRIKKYQDVIEDTPRREQELISLQRDYDNLNNLYNSLLSRKLEAEISVSMEQKQKGEQFRIIDPAKVPTTPVEPDLIKIAITSLMVALSLGGGLAYLRESMDTSFKNPEEITNELKLPVLVNLPFQQTEKALKEIKRKNIFAYTATGLAFILSIIGISMATKGVGDAIVFFQTLLFGP